MKQERKIIAFKHYYKEFMQTLNAGEQRKIYYILDMLATQDRISSKFVKYIHDGIYELRAEYESNIYNLSSIINMLICNTIKTSLILDCFTIVRNDAFLYVIARNEAIQIKKILVNSY